jgi:hypothetical protein
MSRSLIVVICILMFLSACSRNRSSEGQKQIEAPSIEAQTKGKAAVTDCDLDKYKAIREVHFAQRSIILMAKPTYPPEALKTGDEGSVNVDIIIDRDGNVIEACAINGPVMLRGAAQKAALACKFKRNFGKDAPARNQYQRDIITYLFVSSESRQVDEAHYIVVRPPK